MDKIKQNWIFRIIQGMIIGGGAILPGVSGGILCVIFGLYQPMMEILAHPKKGLKAHGAMFIPVLIGWALGFVVFAGIVKALFSLSETVTILLFIGLILGTAPSLYLEAGKEGRPKSVWIGFIIGFIVLFASLVWMQYSNFTMEIIPSKKWFICCGIILGASLVVPGMTSSSIFISLGLFVPITEGFATLDMNVIVPMFIGICAAVICLGKIMNYLFKQYYPWAYHTVLGVVLASTLVITPVYYHTVMEIVLGILAVVLGFWVARRIERLSV